MTAHEAPTADECRADGRTVVVTGASSGIGAAAARRLSQLGATVVPVGRDPQRTTETAQAIGVQPELVDFADLASVRELADRLLAAHERIDVLALNAGATVPERRVTTDGHELTFQANHLGPFLLLQLLGQRLQESTGRVVLTSSVGHRIGDLDLDDLDWAQRRYWAPRVYGTAKLANVLTAKEVGRRLPGVTGAAFHPGVIGSSFGSDAEGVVGWLYRSGVGQRFTSTPEEGARPLVMLATADRPGFDDGAYWRKLRRSRPSSDARKAGLAAGLWDSSAQLLA